MQHVLHAGSSRRALTASRTLVHKRLIHSSLTRYAITNLEMPAMSPTMTEGGISQWKKKEGEAFSAGDVLLEIETDKATIDVEAQDDGILGKILCPDGTKNIPVGKIVALLAEEGDDISNLQPPADAPQDTKKQSEQREPASHLPPSAEPQTTPSSSHSSKHVEHSRPLFPSVLRLLQTYDVPNLEKIKGTGVRGMLTKGDILAHLGMASSPTGTYKETKTIEQVSPPKEKEVKPLDGPSIRRLIVSNLLGSSVRARAATAPAVIADFDSIIADYLPPTITPPAVPQLPKSAGHSDYFEGLL